MFHGAINDGIIIHADDNGLIPILTRKIYRSVNHPQPRRGCLIVADPEPHILESS